MHIIGHLDMDAFFAAIEERNNPQFAGLPIVVGADPEGGQGRGVVSTANYAARAYNIRSAQPIRAAWQASEAAARRGLPRAVFLPGNFKTYGAVSHRIMAAIRQYSLLVQQRSVDEAYFDLTHAGTFRAAAAIARRLKDGILRTEGLTASVGLGPNELIAKIASDYRKPNGLTVVPPAAVPSFLNPLPLRAIPGIGPKAGQRLARCGLRLISDALPLPRADLQRILGHAWGDDLYDKLRGRGSESLASDGPAKSIGHNCTLRSDSLDPRLLIPQLTELCQRVSGRLTKDGFTSYRTVVLTVRLADFTTCTRARTLRRRARGEAPLIRTALRLLLPFLDRRENPHHKLIRLLGIRVEKMK